MKSKPDKPLFPNPGRFHGLAKAIDVNGVMDKIKAGGDTQKGNGSPGPAGSSAPGGNVPARRIPKEPTR